jgi:large subunit ribosomal protein L23
MKALNVYEVIKRPLITEKVAALQAKGKYSFEVMPQANKNQVKAAVQTAFKVTVTDVNIVIVKGKFKRVKTGTVITPTWKKAIVTLKPGDKIELFEGV